MGVVPWQAMLAGAATIALGVERGVIPAFSKLHFGYFGTMIFAYFLEFMVWGFYITILYPRFMSPFRDLPMPKGGHWLMGQFKAIRMEPSGNPHREWLGTVKNDGIIRYLGIFNAERLFITSPKALSEVLVTNSYHYQKPANVNATLSRLLGVGVLLAEGDDHRHQRKGLMPAFSFRHVKELFPVFWDKSCECVIAMSATIQKIAGQGPGAEAVASGVPAALKVESDEAVIEVGEWANRATLDIIGVAGMGKDFNSIADPTNELFRNYRKVTRPSRAAQIQMIFNMFFPKIVAENIPGKRNQDINEAVMVIRDTARELIRAKKAKLERGEKLDDHDILSTAIESGIFGEEKLIDQVMTFLAAGHETTATAMIWAIYMLSLNPEMQTRLREEVRQHLPTAEAGAAITAKDIENLPYLNAVCAEVLRYYPPVPLAAPREAVQDTTILGRRVPKGTHIYIVPWATNRDERLWGDTASEFQPERWLTNGVANGNGGAKSNFAFETFVHGPRSCIGERFARGEFAALLGAFVGRISFELADEKMRDQTKLDIKGGVTAKPSKGLWCKVRQVPGW